MFLLYSVPSLFTGDMVQAPLQKVNFHKVGVEFQKLFLVFIFYFILGDWGGGGGGVRVRSRHSN